MVQKAMGLLGPALAAVGISGSAVLWLAGVANAGAQHSEPHSGSSLSLMQASVGVSHGATQAACVFMVGLAGFMAAVWLPSGRNLGASVDLTNTIFVRTAWILFGLLVLSGAVELSLYAVRASGEPLSPGLLWEAVSQTRVGGVWLARLILGALTVGAITYAAQRGQRRAFWWGAFGVGCVFLLTLSQLSHAVTEEGALPVLADWVHAISASVWVGGLLGFPLALFGPMRAMEPDERGKMLRGAVRRFSRVATAAVLVLAATGLYAALLHVPDLSTLASTGYGRALVMKLGLLMFLLAAGGLNLKLQGREEEPFGRMVGAELALAVAVLVATGFLTSLPPPPGT